MRFGGEIDNNIQSTIIRRCRDAELRKKLLENNDDFFELRKAKIPLEAVISIGRKHEAISFKFKLMQRNQKKSMATGCYNIKRPTQKGGYLLAYLINRLDQITFSDLFQ